jgi:hypothetical protein
MVYISILQPAEPFLFKTAAHGDIFYPNMALDGFEFDTPAQEETLNYRLIEKTDNLYPSLIINYSVTQQFSNHGTY